ncbi:MAG: DUF4054 domain-containing protein [Cyanobacteria bacterium P01_F01_bin.3]
MTVTVEQFKGAHPDFNGFAAPQIEESLALAIEQCPETKWTAPQKRAKGIKLLTAHYLECIRLQQAMSAATAKSVAQGQASISTSPSGDDLESTLYGKQFKRLQRSLVGRIGIGF